ncbi:MAG: hypothetical protein MJE63_31775 [Proteobacteria bacterium]|nr:hypothetical protein [Pseudomonadota bacterium]
MEKDGFVDFESIIKSQRKSVITDEDMIRTIQQLPSEHMVDYLEFLEHNCPEKVSKEIGEKFLRRLGSKNQQFIEKWAPSLTSVVLKKLEKLVLARADNLLNVYLNLILPDEFLNEFVLLKAKRIDDKFRGHYNNALAMIELAVELNRVKNPDDLFDKFLEMEERYLEENHPAVDINTFYKLVTPMLRRYSVKKGPEEFYDLRNKVLKELRKHGVNPGHLSIDILERRGKHRIQEPKVNYYEDLEFF